MSEAPLTVRCVTSGDLSACHEIRRRVFIEEQRVPEALEMDDLDPGCSHFVAFDGDRPIGTARLRGMRGDAKAERVAVLAAWRKRGAGQLLMDHVEREAAALGFARIVLNAQVSVIPFYERLGYRAEGDRFDEAGIPHRRMTKPIGPATE